MVSERNDKIASMRRQGFSLQDIGGQVGLTKERVRQILKKYYPSLKVEGLTEEALARLLGCSTGKLVRMRERGVITARITGKNHHIIYDPAEVKKAEKALNINCAGCGTPLPSNRQKFCVDCRREYNRYSYPFLTGEQKERYAQHGNDWKKANPKRVKEINARATQKYQEKLKAMRGG